MVTEQSARAALNELVRLYAHSKDVPYNHAWARLYEKYKAAYRIDLVTPAQARKLSPLEYAERTGRIPGLLALAKREYKIN